jgi:hypothetical protein
VRGKEQVLSSKYQVLSSKYQVLSTKYQVLSIFKIRIAVGRQEARGKKQEARNKRQEKIGKERLDFFAALREKKKNGSPQCCGAGTRNAAGQAAKTQRIGNYSFARKKTAMLRGKTRGVIPLNLIRSG